MSTGHEPAFPFEGGQNNKEQPYCGMSLRDWFAGMAMQGLSSACTSDGEWTGYDPAHTAECAYQMADAMLTEREKES